MPHGGNTPVVALLQNQTQTTTKWKGGCAISPNPKGIGFPCTHSMEIKGEPYETSDKKKRRAIYLLSVGTPWQMNAIKAIERGLHGEWDGKDPYNMMRRAEALGIELAEEEEHPDGKWVRITDQDVALTTMQAGAL